MSTAVTLDEDRYQTAVCINFLSEFLNLVFELIYELKCVLILNENPASCILFCEFKRAGLIMGKESNISDLKNNTANLHQDRAASIKKNLLKVAKFRNS